MKKTRTVVWTPSARKALREHVDFIKRISPDAAIRVRKEILATAKLLADNTS